MAEKFSQTSGEGVDPGGYQYGGGCNIGELVVFIRGGVKMTEDMRADVVIHGFWDMGNTYLLDMIIFNLDAGSYLHMESEKVLAKSKAYRKSNTFSSLLVIGIILLHLSTLPL